MAVVSSSTNLGVKNASFNVTSALDVQCAAKSGSMILLSYRLARPELFFLEAAGMLELVVPFPLACQNQPQQHKQTTIPRCGP